MLLWVFPGIIQGHLAAHLIGAEGPFSLPHQFATSFSYPTAFFFGTIDQSYWNFGPLWGIPQSPFLGAGFFLGLTQLRHPFKNGFEKTIVLGLLLSLGPLLLGSMVECMRSVQMLPFLIWIVALGTASMIQNLKNRYRWPVLILFLLLSMGMDGWHLFGVFPPMVLDQGPDPRVGPSNHLERYKAFQVLEGEAQEHGPGLIFSDFVSDIYDQSLLVSTYPFNALRNPNLSASQVSWAAVLCELHYREPLFGKDSPMPIFFFFPTRRPKEALF